MKLLRPTSLLGLVSLSLVLTLFYVDYSESSSPGELSSVHGREEELDGTAGCTACHGDAEQPMSSRCLDCHEEIGVQLAGAHGFHGTIESAEPEDCAACHLEHHGTGFALVGRRAFAVAGVLERDLYEHQRLDFGLGGAHAELVCKDCHELADVDVLPADEPRFLGLDQDCSTCHEDPHAGELGAGCAECHGQEHPFDEVAEFEHTVDFPLVGAHAGQACQECHAKGSPHAVGALVARAESSTSPAVERACSVCHPSPHAPGFAASIATSLGDGPERICAHCHDPEGGVEFRDAGADITVALHEATGFSLRSPHAELACRKCHAREGLEGSSAVDPFAGFRAAYPGRGADECAACHADPHLSQFERGAFKGRGCLACHERHAFVPAAFSIAEHKATAFPLTGSHRAVGCYECHEAPPAPLALSAEAGHAGYRFTGTATACDGCHADAHGGAFDRLEEPHAKRRDRCDHCHDTHSFRRAREGFDHAAWTAFPLLDGHAGVACERCHVPARQPDETGRTFGRAAGGDCSACHADPHVGQFARSGRTDCASCHSIGSFSTAGLSFDHDKDTRFALDETHKKLECAACHRPHLLPGGGTAVRYKPLGIECGDCHDPGIKR